MSEKTNEQPTLSHAELIAADLAAEGGDKRQRRLRDLEEIAKAREADADILKALLTEFSGDPSGKAAIAERQARIEAADAARRQALDALVIEQRSAEAAYLEGVEALRELGEPNPSAAMMTSAQGKEIAGRASQLRRATEAAGAGDYAPPEAVAKALKERVLKRSSAFDAFKAKVESIGKALDLGRPEALRRARESFPEAYRAAVDEPIVMPEPITKAVRETIEKSKDKGPLERKWDEMLAACDGDWGEVRKRYFQDDIVASSQAIAAMQREAADTRHRALVRKMEDDAKVAAAVKELGGLIDQLKSLTPEQKVAALTALGLTSEEIKSIEALKDTGTIAKSSEEPVNKRVAFHKASGIPFHAATGRG